MSADQKAKTHYHREYCDMAGVDELPDEDFVLPIVHGSSTGWFLYLVHDEDTGLARCSGIVRTEQDARSAIARSHEIADQFWQEKILWSRRGDRAGGSRFPFLSQQQESVVYAPAGPSDRPSRAHGPRNAIRCEGRHYVVRTFGVSRNDDVLRGFGGRTFRWVFLDDPTETGMESNDLFSIGTIPERFRDRLPDNARWV